MDENLREQIRLHSAGATVRHLSNFESLKTYKNDFELSKEFISKWVNPFYMEIGSRIDDNWIENVKEISNEITQDITLRLLGDFNWRTRLVGAYFSGIKGYTNQIEIIGTHFLKSEVCCVGHIYALVLASYNEKATLDYLTNYLDYYLQKPELYFDQESVLSAIKYLDQKNGTTLFKNHSVDYSNLLAARKVLSEKEMLNIAKILEDQEGKEKADKYLEEMKSNEKKIFKENIDIEYTKKQIIILDELRKFCQY